MKFFIVTQTNFNEVLSCASTSNDVNNVFISLRGDICLDSIFELLKKWYDLIIVEEKKVKILDDALNLYCSTTNLFHRLQFFLSLDQYQSEGLEMIKTVEKIYQRLCISYPIPFRRLS